MAPNRWSFKSRVIFFLQVDVCLLTYPAVELQLLAAISSSSPVQQTAEPFAAARQQQQQRPQRRQPGLLQRLLLCGSKPRSSRSSSISQPGQQQQVLQLAKTPFSNDSSVHLALLQAVYCAYTGVCLDV